MIQSRVEVSCGSVGLLLFENVPRYILLYKKRASWTKKLQAERFIHPPGVDKTSKILFCLGVV